MFSACEEDTAGTGSSDDGNTGGGTSMYSSEDFVGIAWEETMLAFAGSITTNEDVTVLDAWNPAINEFHVVITSSGGVETTVALNHLNVEMRTNDYDDYFEDYSVSRIEFELSNQSEWNEDEISYVELDIACDYDEDNSSFENCDLNYESPEYYIYKSLGEEWDTWLTWDADTYTLTTNGNYATYGDAWSDWGQFKIASGESITAGSRLFSSGVANEIVSEQEMTEPWQLRIWEFKEDGTVMTEYSTDCSAISPDNEYDCYDNGCEVVWNEGNGMWDWGENFIDDNGNGMWDAGESFTDKGDEAIGCQSVDCESFTSEDECWSSSACEWDGEYDYDTGEQIGGNCEPYGEDSGPENYSWELVNDQIIMTYNGAITDLDGPLEVILDIVSIDDESLVLEMNVEMCDFYGSQYLGYFYYMYYMYYGYDFGTGNYADYFANYLPDEDYLCYYLYSDLSEDIYGLSADQIEAVTQSQTFTFTASEWPSMRVSHTTPNSMITPKLFNRILR